MTRRILMLMILIIWLLVLVYVWLFYRRDGFHNISTGKYRNRLLEDFAGRVQHPQHNKQFIRAETSSPSCRRRVFLVVVVFSEPNGFDRRNAIRCSWGRRLSQKKQYITKYKDSKPFKIVFLLGQSRDEHVKRLVATEARRFGDIVMGQFIDSYYNLTLKTKLGLDWAYHRCQSQYLLKTDDDVFVNIRGLLQWLWKSQSRTGLYTGYCASNRTVVREPGHKWAISRQTFKSDAYPTYCYGMGYVLSQDVVAKIMTIINKRPLFVVEDVFIGMLLKELDVVPVDNRKYFLTKPKRIDNICQNKHVLVAHKIKSSSMLELHLKFLNTANCT